MVRLKSPSRFLKHAFFCALPAESQNKAFWLQSHNGWFIGLSLALSRCTETGNGRVGDGHRERKYRHYTVRDLDGGVYDEKKTEGMNVRPYPER